MCVRAYVGVCMRVCACVCVKILERLLALPLCVSVFVCPRACVWAHISEIQHTYTNTRAHTNTDTDTDTDTDTEPDKQTHTLSRKIGHPKKFIVWAHAPIFTMHIQE